MLAVIVYSWRVVLLDWIVEQQVENISLYFSFWPVATIILFSVVVIAGIFKAISHMRGFRKSDEQLDALVSKKPRTEADRSRLESHLKPLLFPCRTTHLRMFPKRHSFDYSYLLVGIPIPWNGRRGGLISAAVIDEWGNGTNSGWLQVRAEDHLGRSDNELGLDGKLRAFLNDQGIKEDEWHHAYLVTAPRFLGYVFNPVSFWYIYGHEQDLKMMILEVNNTFDERRMYFLRTPSGNRLSEAEGTNGPYKNPNPVLTEKKYTQTWSKDFHVSPFNSRKGSYTLKAVDPFHHGGRIVEIDNTIILKSSKNHAKLVARVFSCDLPQDPTSLTAWESLSFVAAWWWVGLVTFPRILREAAKIYFKRKLHVWVRPEVALSSMGRNPTATEM